jgi:SPP1 gp7 family putative phage head morphogenesis protein
MDVLQAAADDRLRLIGRIMNNAQQQLAKDAQRIFQRFAGWFDLTDAEARAALTEQLGNAEIELLKAKVVSLPAGAERLAAEIKLNSRAYAARISRIEALQQNIAIETQRISRVIEDELTGQLRFTAVEGYGRTTYDLQVRSNSAFSVPDIRGLKISIDSPWAGANYSTRIWGAQATLARDLEEIITSGYLGGQSNASVARQIAERFSVHFRDAERLVRTETSYIAGQSAKAAYVDAGVETYRYKTAWDDRTCKFCAPLDGRIFKVSEALVGVNYPPSHPNCRCTTGAAGIVEPVEYKVRRNLDGTVVQIPGDMNYEEWVKWQEADAPADIGAWRKAA